jgi:hypothetical protein
VHRAGQLELALAGDGDDGDDDGMRLAVSMQPVAGHMVQAGAPEHICVDAESFAQVMPPKHVAPRDADVS